MTVVIGTAGHIDHGKTSLLRALTGIDADRLPEERRRGMTIDVGYAWLRLHDGREIDFVDVPGHDRLVGNMLVGAGEIDAALLVVAADDGPRAQTLEHLELLDALEIRHGIAVVTKADVVDGARVDEVQTHVRDLLASTSLSDAPVLAASAEDGTGIEALRAAIAALASVIPIDEREHPRLAIDRAFIVRGRGLVVTGTLRGGTIARGDVLGLMPSERGVRVREVQVHGETVDRAGPGRAALAIAGVELDGVERGMVLTTDPDIVATRSLIVALRSTPGTARLQLHTGTAQVGATVSRSVRERAVLDDGRIVTLLRLERPLAIKPDDRFVLRRPSPARTESGGVVLDAAPPRGASRRRISPERLAALASDNARLELHGAVGERLAPDVDEAIVHAARSSVEAAEAVPVAQLRTTLVRDLRRLVAIDIEAARDVVTRTIDDLVARGVLVRDRDVVRDARQAPPPRDATLDIAMSRLETLLDVAAPPPLSEAARVSGCPPVGIRALESDNRIVRVDDDLAWSRSAYDALERQALDLATPEPLTPAALRDATGTSRKYVMALLQDLDRRGVLRRTPAGHVPGPRAPIRSG
jgi:selenocysteine-specific elongation factor